MATSWLPSAQPTVYLVLALLSSLDSDPCASTHDRRTWSMSTILVLGYRAERQVFVDADVRRQSEHAFGNDITQNFV